MGWGVDADEGLGRSHVSGVGEMEEAELLRAHGTADRAKTKHHMTPPSTPRLHAVLCRRPGPESSVAGQAVGCFPDNQVPRVSQGRLAVQDCRRGVYHRKGDARSLH